MIHETARVALALAGGFIFADIAGADLLQLGEVGGIIIFWLRVEHRLTRMETIIAMKHKLPEDSAPGGLSGG